MVDEKNPTADAEETTQDTPPEITLESVQAELEATKAKLTEATTGWETSKQKAQAEEKNVSKKDRAIKSMESRERQIADLEKKFDVVTTMVADLVDRGDYGIEDEPRKVRRSEEYLKELNRAERSKELVLPEDFIDAANKADKLAKAAGLDLEESDELAKAYRYFMKKDGDEGLAEVERVIEGIQKAKDETPKKKTIDELTDEDREEIVRQWDEKKGKLHTDDGRPSGQGGHFTRKQLAEMSPATYAENKKAIDEAYAAGRIK
tara:strand:- start:1457 stop:2245 length:789 start_codon:yes stop_codon:yes gene_type:complete